MKEDDNHLIIECLRAGVYDLHLTWRPGERPEWEHVTESGTTERTDGTKETDGTKKETDGTKKDTNGMKTKTDGTVTDRPASEHASEPPRSIAATHPPSASTDTTTRTTAKPEVSSAPAPAAAAPGQSGTQVSRAPRRPLYSLELLEVSPTAAHSWVRHYYGAGTSCRLLKLKPNALHRVRVRSDAGLSQPFSFRTLAAPVSVSDLHRAVQLGRLARAEAILTQRPRAVDAASAYGLSALMVAARDGLGDMCALLLRAGADPDRRSAGAGKTALMLASFAGHVSIVDHLLSAGACVSAQDRSGRAALHHAADGGSQVIVRRLVAAGAPLEQTDCQGWTPLMRAVMLGGPVSTLVELGAMTDGCDARGRQLRRLNPRQPRAAQLLSVWRRSARVLPPWGPMKLRPPCEPTTAGDPDTPREDC